MRDETSYQTIAPFYDWIMAHVDYDAWGRYLQKVWQKMGVDAKSDVKGASKSDLKANENHQSKNLKILELGAGTCPFARREVYPSEATVIYSDLSPYMLNQAHDVAKNNRVAANVLALPFKSSFHLCIMIYDAINYLMDENDIEKTFQEVFRLLDENGVFIFDITTEENSKRHFDHAVDYGEMEGCTYFRESGFDPETKVQSNDFIFFVEQKLSVKQKEKSSLNDDLNSETKPDPKPYRWKKIKENHQQRIYSIETMRNLAMEAGFIVSGIYEGFTFRAARDTSERIHFVLRKPPSP